MDLFETPAEIGEYLFRIQDNGGESADRYTVVFSDGDYIGMSGAPSHPQGISMWGEGIDPQALCDWAEEGRAIDLQLGDLPEHLQLHIMGRLNEGWRDFLAAIEAREPHACARTRDKAKVHQGLMDNAGVGIYSAGEGFCVRTDQSYPEDGATDMGPFMTAREALLATLPDEHAMAGPEYHSPVATGSVNPVPGTAEAIAALEAKHTAAYEAELDQRLTKFFG